MAIVAVCALAFAVGTAVRSNIVHVEGRDRHSLPGRLGTASALTIAVAYAISVGLYLQIMASYAFDYLDVGTLDGQRLVCTIVVVLLVTVGVARGFGGLSRLETFALATTLVIITAVLLSFLVEDLSRASDLSLPPAPDSSWFDRVAILGGILIAVQGFETSRYLGAEYSAEVRVRTSRWSQVISSAVYIALVALCLPLMATASGMEPDDTLLGLVERVLPFLVLPLALTGVFSQFSAAIADLVTAVGNVVDLGRSRIREAPIYLAVGGLAITVVWIFTPLQLVAVASRAFAAFYALQCLNAALTRPALRHRAGFGLLATAMVFIVLFAEPVG